MGITTVPAGMEPIVCSQIPTRWRKRNYVTGILQILSCRWKHSLLCQILLVSKEAIISPNMIPILSIIIKVSSIDRVRINLDSSCQLSEVFLIPCQDPQPHQDHRRQTQLNYRRLRIPLWTTWNTCTSKSKEKMGNPYWPNCLPPLQPQTPPNPRPKPNSNPVHPPHSKNELPSPSRHQIRRAISSPSAAHRNSKNSATNPSNDSSSWTRNNQITVD
mmetsp:Transcript_8720/g.17984  ORF Transcript_8720/g.17984 Transcript_8720/m.17984 type:complete len:217 (+) Transcript_8720:33-683(+)